jgi:hypothetical protein
MIGAGTDIRPHLRGLDADEWTSFVAALWRARGFAVTRTDGVLVVTRDGTERVVFPFVDGGRRLPERDVDVAVTPAEGPHVESVAQSLGARVLDGGDVAEILGYAVDREAATALCERFLGGPPESLRPPLRTRLRRLLGGPPAGVAGGRSAVLSFVLAVAVVGSVAGVAVVGVPPDDVRTTDTPTESAATTPTVIREAAPGVPAPDSGVGTAARVDAGRLLSADRAVRSNASYRLDRSVVLRGRDSDRYLRFDWSRRVEGDVVAEELTTLGSGTTTVERGRLWRNESTVLTRTHLSNGNVVVQSLPEPPSHHQVGLDLPARALAAGNYRIDDGDDDSVVLVSTTEFAPSPDVVPVVIGNPRGGRARLVVTESGLVRAVSLRFEADRGGEAVTVAVDYRLSGLGRTTVEGPDWVAG